MIKITYHPKLICSDEVLVVKCFLLIDRSWLTVFTPLSQPSEVPSENRKKNTETKALQKPTS